MLILWSREKFWNHNTRKKWKKELPKVGYTNGSKTDKEEFTEVKLKSQSAIVLQVKLTAVQWSKVKETRPLSVVHHWQSAIRFTELNSRLMWDCLEVLSQLGCHNRVTLLWILKHERYQGNEKEIKVTMAQNYGFFLFTLFTHRAKWPRYCPKYYFF